MLGPPSPTKDTSARLLVFVLTAVMGSFVVSALVVQESSAEIEALSDAIVTNSAPSIERLAELRSLVFEVELMLSRRLQDAPNGAASNSKEIARVLDALDRDVQGYLHLRLLKDEQPFWDEIQTGLVRFDESVRSTVQIIDDGRLEDAQREFARSVDPAGKSLIESALKAIAFHAQNSRTLAEDIRDVRRRALVLDNVLTAFCLALGIGGIVLVLRQSRRHRALVEAHTKFLEARANELEQFAGRVAHDIRNPLSAAKLAAQLALRRSSEDPAKEPLVRILRSLTRADQITGALLDFARSGAQPDPGARTDPGEVLEDLSSGTGPEAEQFRIELLIEPVPPVLVACSTGVYLSLVGNLVRNAMKYMGDSVTRRIVVRVIAEGAAVRTEVEDTGPGIPAESLPSLFEAYFQGAEDRGKEGLGLGLATVKKLAEGHHGRVGVESERGKGSKFWFVLPRAASPWKASDADEQNSSAHAPHTHH